MNECEPINDHRINVNNVSVYEIEDKVDRKCSKVNRKLLPIKCHYFLEAAAASCVEPFTTIYARQLGISVTSVAVVQSITPFLGLISKPILGGLVDYFQTLKLALIIIILIKGLAYLIIPFTPEKSVELLTVDTILTCSNTMTFHLPENLSSSWLCLISQPFPCTAECSNCSSVFIPPVMSGNIKIKDSFSLCKPGDLNLTVSYFQSQNPMLVAMSEYVSCFQGFTAVCNLTCPCTQGCCPYINDIVSVQFYLFLLMRIIVIVVGTTVITLGDTACYELLEGKFHHFGRQRVFASLGWGLFSLITGVLIDAFPKGGKDNYTIGAYIMAILVVIQFFVALQIQVKVVIPSKNILKDVGRFLTSFEAIMFIIACTVCGALESINENYLFLYLIDMGAKKTLLSLTLTLNVLSEIPAFLFAGVIIEKLGNLLSIVVVLLAFSVRHLFYSLISNPWLALPIGLCHGVTFGIFYVSMTSYAKMSAKTGTEATMQGLVNGFYLGIGRAIGSLAAGYSLDKYGGKMTFRISGTVSGIAAVAMFISYQQIRMRSHRNRKKSDVELKELR